MKAALSGGGGERGVDAAYALLDFGKWRYVFCPREDYCVSISRPSKKRNRKELR